MGTLFILSVSLQKGDRFTEDEFQAIRALLGTSEGKIDVKKVRVSLQLIKETSIYSNVFS